MATRKTSGDPTERMLAALGRIETELHGVRAEAKETNQRLGRVEGRLEGVETRLEGVETRLEGVETRLEGVETQTKRTISRRSR